MAFWIISFFYKSTDGNIARLHTPISPERIASDPSFARTRENMAEFGRAGRGAKLLRVALRSELQKVQDRRASNRLLRELVRIIKTDAVSPRGERNLVKAEKTPLVGFEFNATARLGSTFFAPFTTTINRASGEATVSVPAFNPANSVEAPEGATHFRINTAVVAVDFGLQTHLYAGTRSQEIEQNGATTELLTLTSSLQPNPAGAMLLVVGLEFFQKVNNNIYALNHGTFNALAIVEVKGEA